MTSCGISTFASVLSTSVGSLCPFLKERGGGDVVSAVILADPV